MKNNFSKMEEQRKRNDDNDEESAVHLKNHHKVKTKPVFSGKKVLAIPKVEELDEDERYLLNLNR